MAWIEVQYSQSTAGSKTNHPLASEGVIILVNSVYASVCFFLGNCIISGSIAQAVSNLDHKYYPWFYRRQISRHSK